MLIRDSLENETGVAVPELVIVVLPCGPLHIMFDVNRPFGCMLETIEHEGFFFIAASGPCAASAAVMQ